MVDFKDSCRPTIADLRDNFFIVFTNTSGPPMPVIKFVKENKEVEVPEGENLRQAAIKAGINLHQGLNGMGQSLNKIFNCHGLGGCGTCRVLVKEFSDGGTHETPTENHQKLLR